MPVEMELSREEQLAALTPEIVRAYSQGNWLGAKSGNGSVSSTSTWFLDGWARKVCGCLGRRPTDLPRHENGCARLCVKLLRNQMRRRKKSRRWLRLAAVQGMSLATLLAG